MKLPPFLGAIRILSTLAVGAPLREQLVAILINDQVVVLTLVVLIEDQHICHDTVTSVIVSRPNRDLKIRIFILYRASRDLSFCPLIHRHLRHPKSSAFRQSSVHHAGQTDRAYTSRFRPDP